MGFPAPPSDIDGEAPFQVFFVYPIVGFSNPSPVRSQKHNLARFPVGGAAAIF